jgi:hypothetical protein
MAALSRGSRLCHGRHRLDAITRPISDGQSSLWLCTGNVCDMSEPFEVGRSADFVNLTFLFVLRLSLAVC